MAARSAAMQWRQLAKALTLAAPQVAASAVVLAAVQNGYAAVVSAAAVVTARGLTAVEALMGRAATQLAAGRPIPDLATVASALLLPLRTVDVESRQQFQNRLARHRPLLSPVESSHSAPLHLLGHRLHPPQLPPPPSPRRRRPPPSHL